MSRTLSHCSQVEAGQARRVPGVAVLDAATVDFYLRRGREERARAFSDMIRGVFSSPESRRGGDSVALRGRDARSGTCAECAPRAA